MSEDLVAQWERVQTKTFSGWVNSHIVKRGKKINSVLEDLDDGIALLTLLEVISGESVGKFNQTPKMRIHKIENLNKALKFIQEHGVKLASIGSEEICDKNVKLTLGLIWTIILRFAIAGLSEEGLSAKEGLLLWCRRKTEPYDNVDIKDFTNSWQDGLAFCALIHRHRPDLIDYHSLNSNDKLGNLNLAFDVAKEHLDVARLLDAEDIVNTPKPDERSIMTYVAQLYQVFSSLDKIEIAGRRIGKLLEFARVIFDLQHDYERRTKALKGAVIHKSSELKESPHGNDYNTTRGLIADFRQYRKTQKRQWVQEQEDLAALFNQIQAKLKINKRPPYVPPSGLSVSDVDHDVTALTQAEQARRSALNAQLRSILDSLRQNFANKANHFADQLNSLKGRLADSGADIDQHLNTLKTNQGNLESLASQLPSIEAAEKECEAANIEENEYTDHTYDDLWFAHNLLSKTYKKSIDEVSNQIAASKSQDISPEQIEEFRQTFKHFDQDKDDKLSKLEFKSCLSGLGVVELDFEGGDKRFESIFNGVAAGGDHVDLAQFVKYMISITQDEASFEQIRDAFNTLANGKDHITLNDLKVAQISQQQIEFLLPHLKPRDGIDGGYEFNDYVTRTFNK